MRDAVRAHYDRCHVVIMAAAVSDFKPRHASDRTIKKHEASLTLELEGTPDILRELGAGTGNRILVGFAAETDDAEQNAMRKLADKNIDMIVVNDLLKAGSGFGTDTNAVVILDRVGNRTELPTMPKSEIAARIMDAVIDLLNKKTSQI
jgi:phosphopantothenoylcysteine decarboxylase/phosphopantothenate--cysteine ligase